MNFSKTFIFVLPLGIVLLSMMIFSCGPTMENFDDATRLEVSHLELIFDSPSERKKLTIINTSNYPVNWSIESLSPDVVVTPFSGLLAANGVMELEVRWLRINRTGDPRIENLILKSGNRIAREIEVKVIAELEGRWRIPHEIVEAVYDSKRDRIWALTPNRELLEIDPINKQIRTIPLAIQGVKLSIHPEGDQLVVGHENAFSLLELPTGELIRRSSFPFKMADIALAANNWLYVTDSQNQHSYLYCVNLNGSEEGYSLEAPIYSDATITLHPGGEFLLLASTVIMPDDVYRVDIRSGMARLQYDSPYHGEYPFGGKVWFDRSGVQFFTRSGNVHQFLQVQQWDLAFGGNVRSNVPFVFVIAGKRFPRLFTIRDQNIGRSTPSMNSQPQLAIYNASSGFQSLLGYGMPRVYSFVNGEIVDYFTEVPFGFVNQAENRFFLLERVKNHDHTTNYWNVMTVNVE